MQISVINNTGSTILKGKIVRQTGFVVPQEVPSIALASAASNLTSTVLGITNSDISNNSIGLVTVSGNYHPINTSLFSFINDPVYLSDIPGNISPTPGTITSIVGNVIAIDVMGIISIRCNNQDPDIISIQGATGIQGTTGVGFGGGGGITGIQGETGLIGLQGVTGLIGYTGIQGLVGLQGLTGLEGNTGLQGFAGLIGGTGIQGLIGNTGIQGTTGIQGLGVTGLQGLTGLIGTTGLGTNGVTGLTGNTGIQGLTGIIGLTGLQGMTGLGADGNTGLIGNTGIQGIQGTTGIQGLGVTGLQGLTGLIGTTGLGTNGVTGLTGNTGIQGLTGILGLTGLGGNTGLGGGINGVTGIQGVTGLIGTTGLSGINGATGLQGLTGLIGATGLSGSGDALGLTFFSSLGFVPVNTIKSELSTWPTFSSISASASVTYLDSRAGQTTSDGPGNGIFHYYDLGAEYTKILFIVGLIRGSTTNQGIFVSDDTSTTVPTGYIFLDEKNSSQSSLYPLPGYSPLIASSNILFNTTTSAGAGMAYYIDLSAHRMVCFFRWGIEQWSPAWDVTDAVNITATQFRYVGTYTHQRGVFTCPMAIYAS